MPMRVELFKRCILGVGQSVMDDRPLHCFYHVPFSAGVPGEKRKMSKFPS